MRSVPNDHYAPSPQSKRERESLRASGLHKPRMTHEEIARHLGVSRSHVGEIERAALAKFREAMAEDRELMRLLGVKP